MSNLVTYVKKSWIRVLAIGVLLYGYVTGLYYYIGSTTTTWIASTLGISRSDAVLVETLVIVLACRMIMVKIRESIYKTK